MSDEQETTECPFCKETIKAQAVKCRHCGSALARSAPDHHGVCPYCKEDIKPDAVRCRYCHSNLVPADGDSGVERSARGRSCRGRCGCRCGCGCRCAPTPISATARFRTRRRGSAAADPIDDYWACVTECFLRTLGEGRDAWDECVNYVCGDYPAPPDIRL